MFCWGVSTMKQSALIIDKIGNPMPLYHLGMVEKSHQNGDDLGMVMTWHLG